MRNAKLTKFLLIFSVALFSCKSPNKSKKTSASEALVEGEKAVEGEMSPPPVGSQLMLKDEEGDALHPGHEDSNDSVRDLSRPLDLRLSKDLSGQNDVSPQRSMQLTASCSSSLFANVSGGALVDVIRSQDLNCISQMFEVKGTEGAALFNEAKMLEVAAGFFQYSQSYQGTNADGLDQLALYLRAGYYVQFYNKTAVGNYTDVLKNAVAKGLDAFFGNSNFLSTTDLHNDVLAGVIILVDSSSLNARFILKLLPILNRYSSAMANRYISRATNSIFTVYFRGHINVDFVDLIKTNPEPLDAIINFTKNNWLIGNTNYEILLVNAINETARFLQYEETIKAKVRPVLIDFLTRFSMTSPEKNIWMAAASASFYYDKASCSLYHPMVCDLPNNVRNQVLTVNYSCSDSLRIRSQALTDEQNRSACNLLAAQSGVFFTTLKTDASKPVEDDFNTALEAVFFDTPQDYRAYAGVSYGISTKNGGIYLEGTPSKPGNQARFIGYRANWLTNFTLWNLEHEYIHYLDARFDMPGGFGQYMKYQTVWWIEGLAEYVSKRLNNPLADKLAAAGGLSFGEILMNNYESGQDRIYRWGYLAVRYMFEKRGQDIDAILSLLRSNQYQVYNSQLLAIGTKLDADFAAWLKGQDSGLVIPPLVTFTPPPPPIAVPGVGIDVSYYQVPGGVHISWAPAPADQQYSLLVYNGATIVYNGQLGQTSADITGLSGTESLRCIIRVADTQGKNLPRFPDFWIYLAGTPPSPTFSSDPSGKTAGPVTITISYPSNSTQKLYKIGSATTWTTYTAPLTIAVNNTTVSAKAVISGSNQATESTFVVSNIVIPTNPPIPVSGVGIDVSYYQVPGGVHISWAPAPAGQQYSLLVYNGATIVYNGQLGKTSADITGLSGTESLRCIIRVADTQGKGLFNLPEFWIYLAGPAPSAPTFSSNPSEKTAGPVTITISYPSNSNQKLYKIGSATTWKTYTAPLTIAVNNTTVSAKAVISGSNQATESKFVVSNIVTPTNIALGKSAIADSQTTTRTAAMGIDGRTTTYWSSNVNQTTSHFFQVDHGSSFNLTGSEVAWRSRAVFRYKIDISADGVNWITKIDKTQNTRATSLDKDVFSGSGRYVRITITTSKSVAARLNEFRILGFK